MIKVIIHWICTIVGVLGALVSGIWLMVIQVCNPDMTEMRILINNPHLVIICFCSAENKQQPVVPFPSSKLPEGSIAIIYL